MHKTNHYIAIFEDEPPQRIISSGKARDAAMSLKERGKDVVAILQYSRALWWDSKEIGERLLSG